MTASLNHSDVFLSNAVLIIRAEKEPLCVSDGLFDKRETRPPEIRALVVSLVDSVSKSLVFSRSDLKTPQCSLWLPGLLQFSTRRDSAGALGPANVGSGAAPPRPPPLAH